VKSDIFVVERRDFEVNDIKCLWLELRIKGRSIILVPFTDPPPILAQFLDCIHPSVSLAVDSGIRNIVVTGDFNMDVNKAI